MMLEHSSKVLDHYQPFFTNTNRAGNRTWLTSLSYIDIIKTHSRVMVKTREGEITQSLKWSITRMYNPRH